MRLAKWLFGSSYDLIAITSIQFGVWSVDGIEATAKIVTSISVTVVALIRLFRELKKKDKSKDGTRNTDS